MTVTFRLNGVDTNVSVDHPVSLLDLLRDQLELFGSKNACEQGECGSCSVILDGELVCACLVLGADAAGSEVTTVEGLGSGSLHPVQETMNRNGAVQCGFCTPGIVVAAADLFARNPHPTRLQIKEALAGNICRCTGYGAIVRAFEDLAAGEPI